ncbi:hypothetical protein MOUN0_O12882 [Monosporozyma unispora]|nr:hypothetical protein C6P44_000074 [Kazachstania unispora]
MRDEKYYQPQNTFEQQQQQQQFSRQSGNNNYSNDYSNALHQLQRPSRPSRVERLFGIANEIKAGIHNSKTMELGQHGQQVVNVGVTLDNVRRQAFNTDYREDRRDYKKKEKALKKLAKLEEKRLKELRKQDEKYAREMIKQERYDRRHHGRRGSGTNIIVLPPSNVSTHSVPNYQPQSPPSPQHFDSPYISPSGSSSSPQFSANSRYKLQSNNDSKSSYEPDSHNNEDFNEPPPPYQG